MKTIIKITAIFMIVVLFMSSVGCENKNNDTIDTENLIYNVEPTALSFTEYKYVTLEEILDQSTDIVKATCLGFVRANDDVTVDVLFSVDERFRGEETEKIIYVNQPTWRSSDGDIVMSPKNKNYYYEVGESYYLLLTKNMSVFEDYEYYVDQYGVFFAPANKMQDAMINGVSLSEHLELDIDKLEETLLVYIEQSNAPDYSYLLPFITLNRQTEKRSLKNPIASYLSDSMRTSISITTNGSMSAP